MILHWPSPSEGNELLTSLKISGEGYQAHRLTVVSAYNSQAMRDLDHNIEGNNSQVLAAGHDAGAF
jgi:hypothetical protein